MATRTQYVLIDFENVQPDALAGLDAEHFRVLLFVGASQTKIAVDVAACLQRLGDRAEYIRIAGNGPNALDFHIAFHMGLIAARDPDAFLHVVSKDTGFDPLIQHLKGRKVFSKRSVSVDDIPAVKAAAPNHGSDRLDRVLADLRARGASRPRTLQTLANTIKTTLQGQLTDPEVDALVETLRSRGWIAVNATKVTYALPPAP
jgi:hypothetical protein